jgi:LmbE family N-acetylglucosaminyl deacetylase
MEGRRLLCVTAHPDDEVGFGGSLLIYRACGVATYVICLTPGQAATHRGGHEADEDLAAARRAEFAAACEILQVSHGEVLDFPDGRLDRLDLNAAVAALVLRIRQIRPQVVVTFGPEGATTAHPDHSMASIFTTLAYHWAGRSNRYAGQLSDAVQPHLAQKLYYVTAPFKRPERPPVAPAPPTATIDISGYLEHKIRAFRAHASQAPLFPIFEAALRQRGNYEIFHLAARTRLGPMTPEDDLFTGVE